MPLNFKPPRLAIAMAATLASAAMAQGPSQAAPAAAPQPLWELGAFALGVTQPAYPGSSQEVRTGLVLPYFIYRGPLLRADRGTFGLRALKTPSTEVDIGFAAAFGSRANDSSARRGMPAVGTLVEFGPRLRVDLGAAPAGGRWRLAIPLRGVFDLSDGFASRGLSFEPEIGWSTRPAGAWGAGVSLSALIGSAKLADTFYGVAPQFATAQRPAYSARAGLIAWRLDATLTHRLDRDWRVFGFVRADSVSGAANRNSPLVERQSGASAGLGVSWTFARSSRLTTD